jgi:5'-deoxynucleotidase YfbR-like HD superfamily hydrolase
MDDKETEMSKLDLLLEEFRGGDVKRFHTHPTIGSQTVAEHSWGVCVVLMRLYPDCSMKLLMTAVTHDMTEAETGDIPFLVKRQHPEVKTVFDKIEHHQESILNIPHNSDLDEEDRRRLKVADYVESMLYCIRQAELGSKTMNLVMDRLESALCHVCDKEEIQLVNNITRRYVEVINPSRGADRA